MKANLEFNLDEYDDQLAHLRCVKAKDAFLVLIDINEEICKLVNGSDETVNVEELSKKFVAILEHRDINLNLLE